MEGARRDSSRAMRVAASIAIAVAVAVVLLRLRDASQPALEPAASASAPADPDHRRRGDRAADLADGAIAAAARADGGARGAPAAPEPPQIPEEERAPAAHPVTLAEVVAAAPDRVRGAVRPCWAERGEQGPDDQRIVLHYQLVIESGWAYAREVTLVDTQLEPGLGRCIEDHLTALAWEAPGSPDTTRTLQAVITPREIAQ